jgi:hypothetical protein
VQGSDVRFGHLQICFASWQCCCAAGTRTHTVGAAFAANASGTASVSGARPPSPTGRRALPPPWRILPVLPQLRPSLLGSSLLRPSLQRPSLLRPSLLCRSLLCRSPALRPALLCLSSASWPVVDLLLRGPPLSAARRHGATPLQEIQASSTHSTHPPWGTQTMKPLPRRPAALRAPAAPASPATAMPEKTTVLAAKGRARTTSTALHSGWAIPSTACADRRISTSACKTSATR